MSKIVRKRVRVKKERNAVRLINQFWQLKVASSQQSMRQSPARTSIIYLNKYMIINHVLSKIVNEFKTRQNYLENLKR